ncbi:MAG: 4'-phosphopantetheinyl transferase superfamily protein [Anaerolineales bacterium]|nr:4'-phosphopantetheinyl transferase superfamily protein [Anaerolineales bacterium]
MQQDNWTSPPDSLHIESRHVDVWRIFLNLQADSIKLAESTLSADEAQRAARFHFPKDRDHFVAAHGILRQIIGRYLHCKPGELTFSVNQYGKPSLVDSKLEFNLSHSGDFALLAITQNRKIGVDVERVRQGISSHVIAQQYFSKAEVAELQSLPMEQREAAFFTCWTRKEAYIKAQGIGLSLPLESFDVSLSPNEPAMLRAVRPDSQEAARWTLRPLDVAPNYAGALAVEGIDLDFRLWDWNSTVHV